MTNLLNPPADLMTSRRVVDMLEKRRKTLEKTLLSHRLDREAYIEAFSRHDEAKSLHAMAEEFVSKQERNS